MKICILTSVHPVFDVRIFQKQAKTLVKNGYNVTLIAQHNSNESVDGIKIIALPKPRNRFQRTLIDWKLFKLALKQKSDIYHFHDPELLPFGVLLKILTRAKIIYDVHEHYPNAILDRTWIPACLRKIISKLFAFAEKIFVPFLDLVIYTTPLVGARYKKMKVRTERIENYPLLGSSEPYVFSARQKHIIYLGWMSKIRGLYELIEAFALVTKKYPEWKLYLLGAIMPASFAEKIEKLIEKLNIGRHIMIIPWVSFKEKEKYLKQVSIGIVTYLPYANNISCLPNKLFEYMLAGLPVIASNFSLYKEVVEGNNCGICVDPTNQKKMAEAIEYLIAHPNESEKMGENGRRAILEKYNWDNETKKLLGIYKNFKM